jgi:hypothetical protein
MNSKNPGSLLVHELIDKLVGISDLKTLAYIMK